MRGKRMTTNKPSQTDNAGQVHRLVDPEDCEGMAPTSACCFYPRCTCGWKTSNYVYSEEECIEAWQRHANNINRTAMTDEQPIVGTVINHPLCEQDGCNQIAYSTVRISSKKSGYDLTYKFCKLHTPNFKVQPAQELKKKRAINPLPKPN